MARQPTSPRQGFQPIAGNWPGFVVQAFNDGAILALVCRIPLSGFQRMQNQPRNRGRVDRMKNRQAKALLLGMLALAVMAAPTAATDEPESQNEGQPCDVVEIMTFYPFVVIHPECLPDDFPSAG